MSVNLPTKDNYLNFYRVFDFVMNHPDQIEPMSKRPWRSSITARRIEATKYEYYCFRSNGDLPELLDLFLTRVVGDPLKRRSIVKMVRRSTRCGYVHPDAFVLLPISGQWGAGIAVVEGKQYSSVQVTTYYLYNRKELEAWRE